MANKITYQDKTGLVAKTSHSAQWWDDDANEVKTKHNLNDDRITAVEAGQLNGVASYATLADLPGTGTVNIVYKVTNDSTASNNGYYHWDGAIYVKDLELNNGSIVSGDVESVQGGDLYNDIVSENQKRVSFLDFNGSTDGAKFPVKRVLFDSTGWSVELVAIFDNPAQTNGTIFTTQDVGGVNLYINSNELILREGSNEILKIDITAETGIQRTWLITYDGAGSYATFKDGAAVAHTLVSGTVLTDVYFNDWWVGSYDYSSGFLDGKISSIRVWTFDYGTSAAGLYNRSGAEFFRHYKGDFMTLEILAKNSTETNWYDTSKHETKGELQISLRGSQMPNTLKDAQLAYLDAIPEIIWVTVDYEFNLWYDSFIPYYDQSNYRVECECSVGKNMERSYRLTPTVATNYNMTINVYSLDGQLLKTKDIVISSNDKNTGTGQKQVLFIGDSTTDSYLTDYLNDPSRSPYEMIHEFSDMVTADGGASCLFLGTRGVSPYYHEAISGYPALWYVTNDGAPTYPNPFWDGTRNNFQAWMLANSNFGGVNDIDAVFIQLGINDLKSNNVLPHIVRDRMQSLVDSILDATYGYPTARIFISGTPYLGGDRTAWATAFGSSLSAETYVSDMLNLNTLLKERFYFNADNPRVYYMPTFLWVDRKFGYPYAATAISERESTKTENQYIDSVHPDKSGYHQAADSYYGIFRALATSI